MTPCMSCTLKSFPKKEEWELNSEGPGLANGGTTRRRRRVYGAKFGRHNQTPRRWSVGKGVSPLHWDLKWVNFGANWVLLGTKSVTKD